MTHVSPAPPAPLIAHTGCGTFEIGRDGGVRRHAVAPFIGAVSNPAPNVWVAHPEGRLAVYRAGRALWESRVTNTTDNVVISGQSIAFQTWSARIPTSLWLARVGRRERLIARGEEPVAWTVNGLVTQRGNEIRARTPDGRLVRILGLGRSATYDAADRTVLFLTRSGALVRTDGFHVWPLARGFARGSWADLVGNRVIDVTTGSRSVFLRPDGSSLGVSAPLDQPAAVMGSVVALPKFRGIVYVVRRYHPGRDPGINVVYLARPHTRPRVIYRRRIPALSCGEWTKISYSNGRILYADDQGPVAILDVAARRAPLDLTRMLRVLQPHGLTPREMSIDVDWAASPR